MRSISPGSWRPCWPAERRDALLDSYEAERIGFARRLVATTDRVFSFVTAEGRIADIVRTRIAPLVIPRRSSSRRRREFLFRTVSQITMNYRGSPLSAGAAGHVHGGDRLPWVRSTARTTTTSLRGHALAGPRLRLGPRRSSPPGAPSTMCRCTSSTWRPEHGAAGLARDALYLLRPDTYVALADAAGSPEAIARYCAERGIMPGAHWAERRSSFAASRDPENR